MYAGLTFVKKPTYVLLSLFDRPTILDYLFWIFVISESFLSLINGLLNAFNG